MARETARPAPTEPPPSPIENVVEIAADYGIQFG
jgi:hypothetical protein